MVTTATTQAPTPDQERPDRERTEHLPLRFLDADLLQEPTLASCPTTGPCSRPRTNAPATGRVSDVAYNLFDFDFDAQGRPVQLVSSTSPTDLLK